MYLLSIHGQPLPGAHLWAAFGPHWHPHRGASSGAQEADRLSAICNADMGPAEVREDCRVDEAGRSLLKAAMQQLLRQAQYRFRWVPGLFTVFWS